MWELTDENKYIKVHAFTFPAVLTWGNNDKAKREGVRSGASQGFPNSVPKVTWWAFRIFVKKSGKAFDVENVPKIIVDAFCAKQIAEDQSRYAQLGLYPDDTIDYVRIVKSQEKEAIRKAQRSRYLDIKPES
jgi:hypothetical protein